MAPRTRSGAGRPRPTSAGERARSIVGPPVQRVQQGVAGRRGEAGREADPDAAGSEVAQHVGRAGDRLDPPGGDDGLVGRGELRPWPARPGRLSRSVAKTSALDQPMVSRTNAVRLVVARRALRDADGGQGFVERGFDGAVVAHGGAGHVEAGERVRPDHAATPAASSVSRGDGRRAGHAPPARARHEPHAGRRSARVGRRHRRCTPRTRPPSAAGPAAARRRGCRRARARSSSVGVLAEREVERLVVGVGVADREPTVGPLHQEQLEMVLRGRPRSASPSSCRGAGS